jgi:cobaltochelatase CobN
MLRTLSVCLLFVTPLIAAEPPNAVFVLRNSQIAPVALQAFQAKAGKAACDCVITNETLTAERLKQARFLFLEHPSEEFLERVKPAAVEAIRNGLRVATDVPEVVERAWDTELSLPLLRRLLPYWQNGGDENMLAFFLIAFEAAGGAAGFDIPAPREMPKAGAYHPDATQTFNDLAEYLAWYRKAKPGQGALAAVTFFSSYLHKRDTSFVDALIRELEKEGLAAVGVFGWPTHTLEPVFRTPADDPLKVLLSFTLAISQPGDSQFLEKLNVHTIGLMLSPDSYAEWEKTNRGVRPDRISSSLSDPEQNGATDPLMVATTEPGRDGELARTAPIEERVRMAARRARRWVTLAEKPNREKRLVVLYYNNPPGKGNIGASYLNIAPSIRAILDSLGKDGYGLGSELPSADGILDQLEKSGRNVEAWAPGELTRMIAQGGMTLLSMEQYRKWFNQLPERFRKSVNDRWGSPEAAELMVWKSADGRKFFIIPGIRFGNVFLGPQLMRASAAEYTNVQHSLELPPHHGYVASYVYYRHQFEADAIIHLGRHGTLEWLPGKNAGQAGWDASEVILGDLPNPYYYIVDGDGEAIQARRRSAAVEISHLTPMLARAGEAARFDALSAALDRWEETKESSPLVASEYAAVALAEIERLDLDEQIGVDKTNINETMTRIHDFLHTMEEAPIPLGLPTLGAAPSEDRQRAALETFLGTAFRTDEVKLIRSHLPEWSAAIFDGREPEVRASVPALQEKLPKAFAEAKVWLAHLRESPGRELPALLRVLRGEFQPSGPVGDPLGVPDALPTGRNLHQGDSSLIPTKAAWEVGKRLANQLIERHRKEHGKNPERVSMILWMGETGRHQGAMEAQALYLMGVEPEWNARDVVDRLKLIPDEELGRPRVNVLFTASGLYRDGMPEKIIMLDRAARLAASAGDNALSRQNREVMQTLVAGGMSEGEAAEMAGARIFAEAPGAYGFGLSNFVEQSRDKDEPQTMAQLYLTKMNFVYSEKAWGRTVPKLLENQLRGNETILHSRSSNLYGAVDNDDVYQWMGGLRVASETVGAKPELLINNMRRAGEEKIEDARKFIAAELNGRNWNPKWISEMQKEGYSGARVMMNSVEYLYGWQATAPETISPTVWKKTYDVYVADEYELGINRFFETANPAAKQVLVARLLEVDRQGTYQFTPEERTRLVKEYVRLVSQFGVACSANVCGNPRLRSAVLAEARKMSSSEIPREAVDRFVRRFQDAARSTPSTVLPKRQPDSPNVPRSDLLSKWKVSFVDVANFGSAAKRVVFENPLALAAFFLGIVSIGCVVAYGKRRPVHWSALHLDKSNSL